MRKPFICDISHVVRDFEDNEIVSIMRQYKYTGPVINQLALGTKELIERILKYYGQVEIIVTDIYSILRDAFAYLNEPKLEFFRVRSLITNMASAVESSLRYQLGIYREGYEFKGWVDDDSVIVLL